MTDSDQFDRRTIVRAIGGTTLAVGLAGCSSDGGEEPEAEPEDETLEPPAAVDDFLTENEANSYAGEMVDATGQAGLTVDVGAGDSGLTFSPVAVAVDAGTTVSFEWTGEGGGHNVVAAEESEIDVVVEAERIDEAGYTAEHTFEESGTYLYICEPHLAQGKVGAIVVE